jgi:hypothetical protein
MKTILELVDFELFSIFKRFTKIFLVSNVLICSVIQKSVVKIEIYCEIFQMLLHCFKSSQNLLLEKIIHIVERINPLLKTY